MTEAQVTRLVIDHLKKLKQQGDPVWWCKLHGSGMQRAGVPDLVIVYYGHTQFVELKAPGKKPTRLQQHVLRDIIHAQGHAAWADTPGTVRIWLERIKTND